jgi:hypothetical protein
LNFIFGIVCLFVCVCAFSLRRESPDMILGDKPLIFEVVLSHYPNLSTKAAHKLAPRSTRCIFLGYSTDHKGYRCLDLTTNNIVISRHIVFDEADFPFSVSPRLTNDLDILL